MLGHNLISVSGDVFWDGWGGNQIYCDIMSGLQIAIFKTGELLYVHF